VKKVFYQPLSQIIHYEEQLAATDVTIGAKKYQDVNRNTFVEKWSDVLSSKPVNGDVAALGKLAPGQKRISSLIIIFPCQTAIRARCGCSDLLILHELGHRSLSSPDNLADVPPYADELRKRGIEVVLRPHLSGIGKYLEVTDRSSTSSSLIVARRPRKTSPKSGSTPRSLVIFDTVDLHFLRTDREAQLTGIYNARVLAQEMKQQNTS